MKRRSCVEASYYRDLRSLRKWRDSVYKETNPRRQREMMANYHWVQSFTWSTGWTTACHVTLTDGTDIYMDSRWGLEWNPGYEICAAKKIYWAVAKLLRRPSL